MNYPCPALIRYYLTMVKSGMNEDVNLRNLYPCAMSRRHFVALLGAFALSSCTAFPRVNGKGPAMWLARRGSKSVYLFGQMPVLTGTDWLTPDIAAAFDGSDIVWLENPDNTQQSPEIMQAVDALNKRLAPPADFSVLSVLDDDYRNRLLQILKKEGLEPESLKGHRLTYTRQLLSFIRDRDSGADFKKIPEAIFRNRAKASGKPVFTEWRDFLEIVQWAADMPRVQKELVMMAIDENDPGFIPNSICRLTLCATMPWRDESRMP